MDMSRDANSREGSLPSVPKERQAIPFSERETVPCSYQLDDCWRVAKRSSDSFVVLVRTGHTYLLSLAPNLTLASRAFYSGEL